MQSRDPQDDLELVIDELHLLQPCLKVVDHILLLFGKLPIGLLVVILDDNLVLFGDILLLLGDI